MQFVKNVQGLVFCYLNLFIKDANSDDSAADEDYNPTNQSCNEDSS